MSVVCYSNTPTNKIIVPPPVQRQKIPKDGMGARGAPDCYYVSRVLNSTFRYVRFVKRLRALEEEIRVGEEAKQRALKDKQQCDFFIKCDRKSLLHKVERRVNLCLESYERDLEEKRKRLRKVIEEEERENIRKFVAQMQAGNDALWQDKVDRLEFLLQKRAKEHAEKYTVVPISKVPHVHDLYRQKVMKEQQDIHLYQMKEKQAQKEAEREKDRMWHALAMKEAEALAVRMEIDEIAARRRDTECKEHADQQLELNRQKRAEERERLKQETLWLKSIWESENKKEEDAEKQRQENQKKTTLECTRILEEMKALAKKKEEENKLVERAWDALTSQGMASQTAELELIRRRRRETDICNRKMIELKEQLERMQKENDDVFDEALKEIQKEEERRRCKYLLWAKKLEKDSREGQLEQIKDNIERTREEKMKEDAFIRSLNKIDKWGMEIDARAPREQAAIKQNHEDLLQQLEYNKLLKERALQEEQDQLRKYALATKKYEEEVNKMLARPFLTEHVHPFMQQLTAKKLEMKPRCPCSKPTYCK